jgi:predicted dehydrogenase
MKRRTFLQASATAAAAAAAGSSLAAAGLGESARAAGAGKRVGLIGAGWYGKADVLRLIQVAPVEVVSICDVDRRMLGEAADLIASRQASKATPRTFTDYKKMLAEKDLDIVVIGTPDHWHALPMIAAVEAGADVYVQKPISIDVAEGAAMVAAARKTGKVVQVGTQRRSTPHLIEARDRIVREGKLGTIGLVEIYCYWHMRNGSNAPDAQPPGWLDYESWTGPAPMRPYNAIVHPRGWRAFMEYSNGIVGDMCIHMLDMVRWMLGLGWPKRVSSTGGILVSKGGRANITDTQTAAFDFGGLDVWQHRTWGDPPSPRFPWGATFYGDKRTMEAHVMGYEWKPNNGSPVKVDVKYELDEYPEDKTEKDLEKHVAPAIRGHMRNFLACIGDRTKSVADIEEGHISTASCILANLSQKLGRSLAFDPAKGAVVGDDEATKLLLRPYRAGYEHPGAQA